MDNQKNFAVHLEVEFMSKEDEKYLDIINLPHHVSSKHKQMSMEERAAQFAPFAALTGYEDSVKEVVKLNTEKMDK